jgi:hypothetical protein
LEEEKIDKASWPTAVVEYLTHSHNFKCLNTSAAFIGGRKNKKKVTGKWPTAVAQW